MTGLLAQDDAQPPQRLSTRVANIFIPDILARGRTPTKRLGSTAWLDGLRGVAALTVCFMHLTTYTHDGLELCYGLKDPVSGRINDSIAALPFIRLFFSGGHFAVVLFFVISGYVVPRRLLKLLHEERNGEFLEALRGAMVRRPVRLFLPVVMSTFVIALSWHIFHLHSPSFPKQGNVPYELWSWGRDMLFFVYFFKNGWLFSYYNAHSWTIPVEVRGSMFIFVWLFVVHTIKTRTRILMTLAMAVYLSVGSPGAWYACFFAGMFLQDLQLVKEAQQEKGFEVRFPWTGLAKWLRSNEAVRQGLLHAMLVVALYLAGQPVSEGTRAETLYSCHGWKTLGWFIPGSYFDADAAYRWYWFFWAAWMVVYCVQEIDWLRACFELPFAQYLGRHSFALYLVHGPLLTTFVGQFLFRAFGLKQQVPGDVRADYLWIQDRWKDLLPKGGPYGMEINYLLTAAIVLPIFFYIAEVGTRVLDVPGVKASEWVLKKWKRL